MLAVQARLPKLGLCYQVDQRVELSTLCPCLVMSKSLFTTYMRSGVLRLQGLSNVPDNYQRLQLVTRS